MKKIILALISCSLLSGCVNPYVKYYEERNFYTGTYTNPPAANPKILFVGDAENSLSYYDKQGYQILGESSFDAGNVPDFMLKSQAKKVGADMVIKQRHFAGSSTVIVPITTYQAPQTSSTYQSGTIYGSSGGMASYSGTAYTTTPAQFNTSYVPVHKIIWEYHAIFLRKP